VNRQSAACLAACAAVLLTAGAIDKATNHQPAPKPKPASSVTAAADWTPLMADALVELEATTTALHAAPLTGQPINHLTSQCQGAVANYNAAAAHLNTPPINPRKECTP